MPISREPQPAPFSWRGLSLQAQGWRILRLLLAFVLLCLACWMLSLTIQAAGARFDPADSTYERYLARYKVDPAEMQRCRAASAGEAAGIPASSVSKGLAIEGTPVSLPMPAFATDDGVRFREFVWDYRQGHGRLERRAVIDRCSPLSTRLEHELGATTASPFTVDTLRRDAFGSRFYLDGVSQKDALRMEHDAGTATSTVIDGSSLAIHGDSDRVYLLEFGRRPLTHVLVKFDKGAAIWSLAPTPARLSTTEAEWLLQGDDELPRFTIYFPHHATPDDAAGSPRSSGPTLLGNALADYFGWLSIAREGFVYAVPFLIALGWATQRHAKAVNEPETAALVAGCRLALAAIALVWVMQIVTYSGVSGWLPERLFHIFTYVGPQGHNVILATLAVCWARLEGSGSGSTKAPRTLIVLALAAVLLLATVVLMGLDRMLPGLSRISVPLFVPRGTPLVDEVRSVAAFSTLLVAAVLSAWGLTRECGRGGLGVACVLVLADAVIELAQWRFGFSSTRFAFVAITVAAPFGWGAARVGRVWKESEEPGRSFIYRRAFLLAGALLGTLLAFPPEPQGDFPPSPDVVLVMVVRVLLLAWQLAAWRLVLLWLKRRGPEALSARPKDARFAASLLLFIAFFWLPDVQLQTLLLGGAFGYLSLRHGLFAGRPLRDLGRRVGLLARSLAAVRTANRLYQFRRYVIKGLREKLTKGDMDAGEACGRIDAIDALVADHERSGRRLKCLVTLALNAGPGGTAWRRGCKGALVSTLLCMPWIGRSLSGGKWASDVASFAYQLLQTGVGIGRWSFLGFFFMYFYPWLRGRNGIQKGVGFSAAIILPLIAALLMSTLGEKVTWVLIAPFVLWSLQILIACMIMGVALGDVGALRRTGKGPSGLVDIYDLGTLAAWTSSLFLAVGVAITTATATQAGSMVTAGLRSLVPVPATEIHAAPGGR